MSGQQDTLFNPTFDHFEDGTYDDENCPDGFIISQQAVRHGDFDMAVLEGEVHFNPVGAVTCYWATSSGQRITDFVDYDEAVRAAQRVMRQKRDELHDDEE